MLREESWVENVYTSATHVQVLYPHLSTTEVQPEPFICSGVVATCLHLSRMEAISIRNGSSEI